MNIFTHILSSSDGEMTESEAIEILQKEKAYMDSHAGRAQSEAFQIAIYALGKQIPKKPTPIDYEKYMDTVKNALFLKGAYWCPNCNHVVKCGTYCSDCGQKLDWNE